MRPASRIDRRGFVRKAAAAAAGSAIVGSQLGCAADRILLAVPCLVPAALPPAPANMTFLTASAIGCALDCDLGSGNNKHTGGPATDDGPTINAAMAGATASNPITLMLDGSALISGLFLPAGGYWSIVGQGCTTGFFIKSGTNNDGIHNGGPRAAVPSDPGPTVPLPARGSSVTLANFVLNGNQGDGYNGDSTTGEPQGNYAADLFYFPINLMSLDNINLTNVEVFNSPSYHIRLSNVGHVNVTGCVMRSSGPNTDGLHFDGPANDIAISNCDFTTGDDAIALNCPEGYTGNISRVSVSNCTFNSATLMRLYTIQNNQNLFKFQIDTVTVSQCSGTFGLAAFLIGMGAGGSPNSLTSLTATDCSLAAPCMLDISVNFGTITLTRVTMVPVDNNTGPGLAFCRTFAAPGGASYIGGSLTLESCAISRTQNLPVAGLILSNGSSIGTVEFNGFAVQDAANSYDPSPQLLDFVQGSIGQVVIDALSSAHVTAMVSPGGFNSIGAVSGAGVLATAWPIADSVMANGVPYISATTNQPSIKIAGVVQPYP